MGEVYRARDTRPGRDVAVKVLPEHLSSSAEVRARFERARELVPDLVLSDLMMPKVNGLDLCRRVKTLTGKTPTELIRGMRLERAAALLRARAGTVSDVAYEVGFKSVSHFCRSFRETYGTTPNRFMSDPPHPDPGD